MAKNYLISGANWALDVHSRKTLHSVGIGCLRRHPPSLIAKALRASPNASFPCCSTFGLRATSNGSKPLCWNTRHLDGLINNAGVGLFSPVGLLEMESIRNSTKSTYLVTFT